MAKIEINTYDLCIGVTNDGDEVVQFKIGFDVDFIDEMKELGVKERVKREEPEADEE